MLTLSSQRRVGFVLDSPDPSGVGEHLCLLAPRLARRGYSVHLVCRSAGYLERFRRRWTGLGLSLSTLPRPRADTSTAYRQMVNHLRTLRLDIVHLQLGISWEIGRTPQAAAEAGIPLRFATEHLPYLLDDPGEIAAHRDAYTALDTVVTVSDGVRQSFLAQGYPPSLFHTIRNGIDVRRFDCLPARAEARRRLNLPADAPIVLSLARFTEQKAHVHLIAAARQVLGVLPDTRFLLVGHGPLWRATHAAVAEAGLAQHVRFLRRHQDIRLLMAAADLLVLPSLFEGHPLVALEAMAAGLPVLGTEVCGTSETVEHGKSGWLVQPEDPLALAEALVYLLKAPELRCCLAQQAYSRATRLFTADRMADDVNCLYVESLDRHVPYLPGPAVWANSRVMEIA